MLTDDEIAERLYAAGVPRGRNTHEAYRLGWEARGKRDIEVIMGGRFLTDDSPVKKWAEQCALAIARAGKDRAC